MREQVTVIITTRDRPEMLSEALESVRRQTGLGSVARVLVSENGEIGGSKEVCERFTDLPLLYVRQQPPVSSNLHLKALWHHVESPIVAILHDDDWWLPGHLENSVAALDQHPDCVATFSNFFDTFGPKDVPFTSDKSWRVWVSSGCDFSGKLLMLDQVSMLLACLLYSSFHYSTLVGRKEVFWESYLKMVGLENAWDNERSFPVFLSSLGTIGYLPGNAAMIRNHPAQDGLNLQLAPSGFGEARVRTTRWLAQLKPENTALAVKKFNDSIRKVPSYVHRLISSQIDEPQRSFLVDEIGLDLIRDYSTKTKWLVKQLCPPAVVALYKKSSQLLARSSNA